AARSNSLGARATRSLISPATRAASRVRTRRLAMPTWPIFSSPAGSSSIRAAAISGSRRPRRFGLRGARCADPRHFGQRLAIGVLHPLVAAHVLEQHGRAVPRLAVDALHHALPDLAEAEAAVEQERRIVAVV